MSRPSRMPEDRTIDPSTVDFAKGDGLIPIIVQNATTGAVLMLAYADREALERTIDTGEMHFRSRTRGPWKKGETSGNVQRVVSLSVDCDRDAVLARVEPAGPACHTGSTSCFGEKALTPDVLAALAATIADRASSAGDPQSGRPSYTRRLLADRNLRLKKIGEEAVELVVAIADEDRICAMEEGADVLFHVLVGLQGIGVSLDDLRHVLASRSRQPSSTESSEIIRSSEG
jgi:phosphoribosyl-AMP cyclohydrolase / phosphoribosyl-ATP pyrophosphohydrolase